MRPELGSWLSGKDTVMSLSLCWIRLRYITTISFFELDPARDHTEQASFWERGFRSHEYRGRSSSNFRVEDWSSLKPENKDWKTGWRWNYSRYLQETNPELGGAGLRWTPHDVGVERIASLLRFQMPHPRDRGWLPPWLRSEAGLPKMPQRKRFPEDLHRLRDPAQQRVR